MVKTQGNLTLSLKYCSLQCHALGNKPSLEASSSQLLLQFLYRKEGEEQYEKENFLRPFVHLVSKRRMEGFLSEGLNDKGVEGGGWFVPCTSERYQLAWLEY